MWKINIIAAILILIFISLVLSEVVQVGPDKYLRIIEVESGWYKFTLWRVEYDEGTPIPAEILRQEINSWESIKQKQSEIRARATVMASDYQELNYMKTYIPSPTPTPVSDTPTPTPFPTPTIYLVIR